MTCILLLLSVRLRGLVGTKCILVTFNFRGRRVAFRGSVAEFEKYLNSTELVATNNMYVSKNKRIRGTTPCRYQVYDLRTYIHEVMHVILDDSAQICASLTIYVDSPISR